MPGVNLIVEHELCMFPATGAISEHGLVVLRRGTVITLLGSAQPQPRSSDDPVHNFWFLSGDPAMVRMTFLNVNLLLRYVKAIK